MWDGRNACGNDDWNVEDVSSFSASQSISQPITKLEPYTRYAFYVKAFTLATEQKGAQSEIMYFTTKPDRPAKMKVPDLKALDSSRIVSFLTETFAFEFEKLEFLNFCNGFLGS